METGIYILKTAGPEYRVAYSEKIDGIYGEYDDVNFNWKPVNSIIDEIFGKRNVFITLEDARKYANLLAENFAYLDNGVNIIDDFENLPFSHFKTKA